MKGVDLAKLNDKAAENFMLSIQGLTLRKSDIQSILIDHPMPKALDNWHIASSINNVHSLNQTNKAATRQRYIDMRKYFDIINQQGRINFAAFHLQNLALSYGFKTKPTIIGTKLEDRTAGSYTEPPVAKPYEDSTFGLIKVNNSNTCKSSLQTTDFNSFLTTINHEFCHAMEYALSIHLMHSNDQIRAARKTLVENSYIDKNANALLGAALISEFNGAASLHPSQHYISAKKSLSLYLQQFRERHAIKHSIRLTRHFNAAISYYESENNFSDHIDTIKSINAQLSLILTSNYQAQTNKTATPRLSKPVHGKITSEINTLNKVAQQITPSNFQRALPKVWASQTQVLRTLNAAYPNDSRSTYVAGQIQHLKRLHYIEDILNRKPDPTLNL